MTLKIKTIDLSMTKDEYQVYVGGYSKTKAKVFYECFEGISHQNDHYIFPVTPRNTHLLLNALNPNDPPFPSEYSVSEVTYPKITLWKHQKKMRDFILKHRQCIIAAEMRTGKTLSTLVAIIDFIKQSKTTKKTLIHWIAPISGKFSVEQEIEKWFYSIKRFETLFNIDLKILNYEMWRKTFDIFIMENGTKQSEVEYEINNTTSVRVNIPQILILDEIHKVKTGNTITGRVARGFYRAMETLYDEDFLLIGLSGTPAPLKPSDWHNLIEVVAPALIPQKTQGYLEMELAITKREQYDTGGVHNKIVAWREDRIADFQSNIVKRIALTIWKEDVFTLPEKEFDFITLEISQETKRAVKFLNDSVLGEAQLRNKLRQISDGFLYNEVVDPDTLKSKRETIKLPTPKKAQLVKDLKEIKEKGIDRVCVFGGYQGTIEQIKKICLKEGWNVLEMTGKGWSVTSVNGVRGNRVKAKEKLKEFDNSRRSEHNGEFWAVIGHPKSMSTGLELSACSTMIYYSMVDDGEAMLQSIERAHSNNMDKERGLKIKVYCHLNVDKLVGISLKNKKRLQSITMGDITKTIMEDLK